MKPFMTLLRNMLLVALLALSASMASVAADFCWKDSYPRGVGTIPTSCTGGKEYDAALCYKPCPAGMTSLGLLCGSACPAGYIDMYLVCHIDKALVVGGDWGCVLRDDLTGTCWASGVTSCPGGYTNLGVACALTAVPTPAGFSGTYLDPMKNTTGRGVGTIPTGCAAGEEYDAGLCYSNCPGGMSGVGPVCWGQTPAGWTGCGFGAATSAATCSEAVFDQVSSVVSAAADIITLGAANALTKPLRYAKLKKVFQEAKTTNQKFGAAVQRANAAQGNVRTGLGLFDTASTGEELSDVEITKLAFDLASLADPTGLSGIVGAYTYDKCSKLNLEMNNPPPKPDANPIAPPAAASTIKVAPGIPTAVTAYAGNPAFARSGEASVNFSAPANTGGSVITRYTVTSSPGGRTATGAAAPLMVTGLTNGTAYTFTVTATNAIGTSAASVPSSSVIPAGAPDAPTIVTVTPGVMSASVSFTAPASDGGSAITGYTVTLNPAAGGSCTRDCSSTRSGVDADAGSMGLTHRITGLTNGLDYTFFVRASNALGSSTASALSGTVIPDDKTVAPVYVQATAGDRTARVTFTGDDSKQLTGNDRYRTRYAVISTPAGGVDANAGGNVFRNGDRSITGLTNGTAYTFTVTATNSVDTSTSVPSNSVTPTGPPDAPTIGNATSGGSTNPGSSSVTFTAPGFNGGSPITGYTVTSNPAGGVDADAGTTGLTHRITGLTNATAYTFTVTASNANGRGAASAASNSATAVVRVPDAPTIGTATRGNATASVSFTAPGSNGGGTITGYTVTSNPVGGVDANVGTTGLTHSITGLTNGTAYTFTVTATNAVGTSAASVASNSATPATLPAAPTIGTATKGAMGARDSGGAAGLTSASVTFTPSSDGGSPITGYTVTSSPAGGVDANAGTTALTHNITGLDPGGNYTFTVTASNAVGTSAASAASNSVATSGGRVPEPPTNVGATRSLSAVGTASVTFTAPMMDGGQAITGYRVTSNPAGAADADAGKTALTHRITGLETGTDYTFTVKASNVVGDSAASAASNSIGRGIGSEGGPTLLNVETPTNMPMLPPGMPPPPPPAAPGGMAMPVAPMNQGVRPYTQ